jgi:hypothetical protein
MEVKPIQGLKVMVNATREALFGEEGVEIKKLPSPQEKNSPGVLTGRTLVGYCEVEMSALDGQKHWYPIDQMAAENGDTLKEEELPIPVDEGAVGDDDGEADAEE